MNAELRTIPEALDERAAECGEQTAYIFDGVRYTWRDCERQAEAFAAELFGILCKFKAIPHNCYDTHYRAAIL